MQTAFPDADHPPVGRPQGAVHPAVTDFILGEFVFPESPVAFGLRAVPGATMPETAIHKNRQLVFWKNEIRPHLENSDS